MKVALYAREIGIRGDDALASIAHAHKSHKDDFIINNPRGTYTVERYDRMVGDIDKILSEKSKGGGGTSMEAGLDYIT